MQYRLHRKLFLDAVTKLQVSIAHTLRLLATVNFLLWQLSKRAELRPLVRQTETRSEWLGV